MQVFYQPWARLAPRIGCLDETSFTMFFEWSVQKGQDWLFYLNKWVQIHLKYRFVGTWIWRVLICTSSIHKCSSNKALVIWKLFLQINYEFSKQQSVNKPMVNKLVTADKWIEPIP